MSLETEIRDLTTAVEANTKALIALVSGKGKTEASAKEEDAGARTPLRRGSRDEPKDKDTGPMEADLKETVAKFLDLPETDAGNAEYEKRLQKAIDPVFEKANVKELSDLPEKFWPDVLKNIADYEKASAEKSEGGSGRRSRR